MRYIQRALLLLVAFGFSFGGQADAQIFPTYVNGTFSLGNGSSSSSPYALGDTFFLESNPGASRTIYLDFDGHHSVGNVWGHDIVFDAFDTNGDASSFSTAELIQIQRQFQNVAEDFLPFDVNVTTRDPGYDALVRSNSFDTTYGVRAVNTQNVSGSGLGGGGVAYLDSFNWIDDRDNPVWTFNKGENVGGMTNSHEIGHALGLHHDGLGAQAYHPGSGSGTTSWGPIMGAPFGANVTQWSNGDYANSTTTEDDLAIITNNANGINYRTDTAGNTTGTAAVLNMDSDGNIFDWNIIERNTDVDMFSFNVDDGQLILDIRAFEGRPNLDVLAELFDADGNLIAFSNPLDDVDAMFDLNLSRGQYFLSVTGTGRAGLYSDYGSLGFYSIMGSATAIPEPGTGFGFALMALMGLASRRQRT